MLDLDGDVVGDGREFAMEGVDEVEGVLDAVEKIGIADGDVLRARGDLLADISEDDATVDDAEDALVDRNDGAVAAQMLAAATGFGVAGDAVSSCGQDDVGIVAKWR